MILIDEWVAYARSLVGRDDLAAGTFDDQFTFAQALTEAVKGTPGVLLAIFFAAAGDAAAAGRDTVAALRAGLERVRQVGGAAPGDRTMIDALEPALVALPEGPAAAARAARLGADATGRMAQAGAGRASYQAAGSLAGHNDPGAEAAALLFEALARPA